MKCKNIKIQRDDYLNGSLALTEHQAIESHLASCQACRQSFEAMKLMLAGLKELAIPNATADFENRVLAEVRRQNPKQATPRPFAAGFATAMAAGFALWFITTLFFIPQQATDSPNVIMVAMNNAQTVRLVFNAPSDLEQVSLSIGLPENFELSGYPGRNKLSWKTNLKKGENILALPILAIDMGKGELVAEIRYGEKLKIYRLVLKTTDKGVMKYVIQSDASA